MSSMTSPGSPLVDVGHKHEQTAFGAWRAAAVVISSLIALLGLAALVGATAAVVLDQTQRDHDGYLSTGTTNYSTDTYALVSDSYRAGTAADWFAAREILGKVRITVTSSHPVFLGVAPAAKASSYLAGIRREQGPSFEPDRFGTASHGDFQTVAGGAPRTAPANATIWAASTTGAGTHTLVWTPKNGDWRVVLMNADASAGVNADMSIGAKFPHLLAIGLAVGGIGLLLLLASAAGLIGALQTRGRP